MRVGAGRWLLVGALASCSPTTSDEPPAQPASIKRAESGQHFCCETVSAYDQGGTVGYGTECVKQEATSITSCTATIYCPGGYILDASKVKCPL